MNIKKKHKVRYLTPDKRRRGTNKKTQARMNETHSSRSVVQDRRDRLVDEEIEEKGVAGDVDFHKNRLAKEREDREKLKKLRDEGWQWELKSRRAAR